MPPLDPAPIWHAVAYFAVGTAALAWFVYLCVEAAP